MEKKPQADLGRQEAEAVTRPDSDALLDLLRLCQPRHFPAEQPSREKQQFKARTALWALCSSVLSTSRHLTAQGRDVFIGESFIPPAKERLMAFSSGWRRRSSPSWSPAAPQVQQHPYLLTCGLQCLQSGICPSGISDQTLGFGCPPTCAACSVSGWSLWAALKHLSCPSTCKAKRHQGLQGHWNVTTAKRGLAELPYSWNCTVRTPSGANTWELWENAEVSTDKSF